MNSSHLWASYAFLWLNSLLADRRIRRCRRLIGVDVDRVRIGIDVVVVLARRAYASRDLRIGVDRVARLLPT